ncbi:MAG: adenosylmethionine--8-amino-7-oxononanoate transaminase, partial [Nitrospirae bacterium]|nr:adenosylmethionine--8-amino-7-oxononanoate transaminase [Nitrospirota bacterium]
KNLKLKTQNSKLSKVFYSDDGSTSVEAALKMAFQYWIHKGIDNKNTFLSLRNAYHGDTLGAVSVGGIETFHKVFSPLLFKTYDAPSPYCYRCELDLAYPDCKTACLDMMEDTLRENSSEIAAVIIEPIVQAAGGIIVSPPGYLKGVRDLCTRYNVFLIADEVATGFGRTGKMFACGHEDVVPDIMCLSKGITGGYLPLAVTVATDEIYNVFLGEFKELKTFFHGHSFTGNPLACAAAIACLEIFEREETIKNLQPKIEILEKWLKEISGLSHVGDVRNKGFMAGIELVKDKNTKEPYEFEDKVGWKVAYHARDNGVIIRPLGNVIVIMPPLSISVENLLQLLKVIKDAIIAVT